uniref:Uncharacterized protein n=1 Tax=Pseudomonas aeruginosa TaxID=287 RepID=Q1W4V7_PSEAI|nr:hypothetical protein EXB29 [Pseudomonas aeruginosa]
MPFIQIFLRITPRCPHVLRRSIFSRIRFSCIRYNRKSFVS